LFGQLYYIPLYFASVKGKSPSAAGLSMLPCSLTLTPSAAIVGRLITRLGRFRWAIWTGWAVATLATGLLVLWDIDTSTPTWVGILICLGIGHALLLTAQNFAVQAMAQIEDAGHAATMYAFMRTLGTALGVAIGSSVFQNLMLQKLEAESLPPELAKKAEGFLDSLQSLPSSPMKDGILLAYMQGIRGVFIVLTGISGAALLGSLLIKSYSLDQQLGSVHVLRKSSKSSDEKAKFRIESGSTN
jgi:MFS family permease